MITKAIITEVIDDHRVKVRVPIYDKFEEVAGSINSADLSAAIMCTLPGIDIYPSVDDVVIVGFEENTNDKPVILGFLYCKNPIVSRSILNSNSISIKDSAELPNNITIDGVDLKRYIENIVEDRIYKILDSLNITLDKQTP